MKKILIVGLICELLVSFVYSQTGDHVNGGRFSKNIEYNLLWLEAGYNFNSKGAVEKLFFGDFNAPIEFFYVHPFEGYSGFRIVRDTLKMKYIIEIKHISNYKEAQSEAAKNHPTPIGIPADKIGNHIISTSNMTKEERNLLEEERKNKWEKYIEERNKLFKIESRSFPISNQFAEELYKMMVSIIDNFKARGIPPHIVDGEEVTFRTVVEDEVWSLKIHEPQGNALKLADICKQIITDFTIGKPDELSYIKLLENF